MAMLGTGKAIERKFSELILNCPAEVRLRLSISDRPFVLFKK